MRKLTDRQTEVYEYCLNYTLENHNFPTFKEIGKHFGFSSPNATTAHLKAISARGFIEKVEYGGKYKFSKIKLKAI